ncbi:MAG: penicillin-binding transpeptidase domain-containing protein, partial [Candidatus Acidiferrales bacterium]
IALRLGAPRFYDVIRDFGFGQLTGIVLPGENRGLFRPLREWTPSSIGSIAIGQEVSATPVQIVSAVSAIANGGTLYPPRVVHEIDGDHPITLGRRNEPRQVTDGKTAATVRGMMESVILDGTGRKFAQLNGYTAAGKSGTAQLIDPATGRYAPGQFNASFVGFAPVNDPVVTILVVLDTPVGIHEGGPTAGPVFKRIAEQVLAYLDVPHDVPQPSDVETARNSRVEPRARPQADPTEAKFEAAVRKMKSAAAASSQTVAFGVAEAVVVPNLINQSVRGVTQICTQLGLAPSLIGDGIALEQSPEAGTRVLRGSRVMVRFGRPGEATTESSTENVN